VQADTPTRGRDLTHALGSATKSRRRLRSGGGRGAATRGLRAVGRGANGRAARSARPSTSRRSADARSRRCGGLGGASGARGLAVVWRISVPPSPRGRTDALAPERWLLDWGGGLIWAAFGAVRRGPRAPRAPRRPCDAGEGAARACAPSGTFQPPPAAVATAIARVKAAFDPDGRLNPRRDGLTMQTRFTAEQLTNPDIASSRADAAQVRALRLLHGDLPDLCAARRRARQPARAHLSDQGDARARARRRPPRSCARRPLPVLPRLHDDLPVRRSLPAPDRPCARARRAHVSAPLADRLLRADARVRAALAGALPRGAAAGGLAQPFALLPGCCARCLRSRRAVPALAAVRGSSLRGERRCPARGKARMRVALLEGCVQSVLAPQINARRGGCSAGSARRSSGVGAAAGRSFTTRTRARQSPLAAPLIERLDRRHASGRLDAVVVNASGCGTHVKDYGTCSATMRRSASAARRQCGDARRDRVSGRARPAPDLRRHRGRLPLRLLDAARPEARRAPRELLRAPGFDVATSPRITCAAARPGSYNLLQPEIAGRLRERKLANVARTGAQLVATGNIGCITQLTAGGGLPIVHTVELLDWAGGGPRPATLAGIDAVR
jgi:glycolate oxidase iron-sulfur subunit